MKKYFNSVKNPNIRDNPCKDQTMFKIPQNFTTNLQKSIETKKEIINYFYI